MHLETSSWTDVKDAAPTVALLPVGSTNNTGHSDRGQVERTLGYIEEAEREGAAFVTGGSQPDDEALSDACFVAPTRLTD